LIEEEKRGKSIAPLESSSDDEYDEATDTDDEGSSNSSGSGSDVVENSEHEENSPKVDITGYYYQNICLLWRFV
jgi:hypothetical protein